MPPSFDAGGLEVVRGDREGTDRHLVYVQSMALFVAQLAFPPGPSRTADEAEGATGI